MSEDLNPADHPLVTEITSNQDNSYSLLIRAVESSTHEIWGRDPIPDTFCFRFLFFLKAEKKLPWKIGAVGLTPQFDRSLRQTAHCF